jgi:endoglucanase
VIPLALFLACSVTAGFGPAATGPHQTDWPLWSRFSEAFISNDGRVIDRTADEVTTSEGQAYALFFSLLADDRPTFVRLLAWTRSNLAAGDLTQNLPAWKWGRGTDGTWGVIDPTPASDADLWLAYTLLEAGRLWCDPPLTLEGNALLALIAKLEVTDVPELGPTLMPGPSEYFVLDQKTWRLNPSYLFLPALRRLATLDPAGPWAGTVTSALRVLTEAPSSGYLPDWIAWEPASKTFVPDPIKGGVAGFDAIRLVLWAGLVPATDETSKLLDEKLAGPLLAFRKFGKVPVRVTLSDPPVPTPESGPAGYYAALLPLARRHGDADELTRLRVLLATRKRNGLYGAPPAYYDQCLALFGEGHAEQRYAFSNDGRLDVKWESRCD